MALILLDVKASSGQGMPLTILDCKVFPGQGGLQVYPPPTTPPEPAPPDRECVEGPPRRLVKATTLPAPTLHSATSRTSLDDLTSDLSGSRDSLNTRDSGWVDDSMCSRRPDDYWAEGYGSQAFTTGRRTKHPLPPGKPRQKASQTLKTFQSLSDAVYQVTNKRINLFLDSDQILAFYVWDEISRQKVAI
ncbi:hypothetical protein SK128_019352 [Halocaridina rubra]|uniref:Uncharacterized protein n=1 Tax=Halocaridina rubra TaxID=373956 RepID=A0AAN8XDM8_HALRR